MSNRGITRFVLLSLLALLPALLVVGLYLIKDPFNVLSSYDGEAPAPADTVQLTVNAGYISTEAFNYFYPTRHFDSFTGPRYFSSIFSKSSFVTY